MAEIKFLVEGIVCTGCAMDMENVLLDLDGIEEASVNFRTGFFPLPITQLRLILKPLQKKLKILALKLKYLLGKLLFIHKYQLTMNFL